MLAPPDTELMFIKFSIKNGYWRITVPQKLAYNFKYVLPELKDTEETIIAIPYFLQMRLKESPTCFFSAPETARNVTDEFL